MTKLIPLASALLAIAMMASAAEAKSPKLCKSGYGQRPVSCQMGGNPDKRNGNDVKPAKDRDPKPPKDTGSDQNSGS